MRILAGLAFAIALAASSNALACSCGRPSADEIERSAAAIFDGVVVKTRTTGERQAVTTFRVTTAYKGVRRGQLVRVQHRTGHSASCAVNFRAGDKTTVNAHSDGPIMTTGLCASFIIGSEAGQEVLRRLGKR